MNKFLPPFLVSFFMIFSCSKSSIDSEESDVEIQSSPFFGTYLYFDNECGGQDIQYATINVEGITFYDLLSDACDDTIECYTREIYELAETSNDTFLILSDNEGSIQDAKLYIQNDTVFTITYQSNNGTIKSYNWEKIKTETYFFNPVCDQDFGNTKDIANILAYAVSNEGELIWETYIDGGLWDIGKGITPLSNGGYMIFGQFDAIEWGGCCYTYNSDVRDFIKLDAVGNVVWQKQITFSDDGISDNYLGLGKTFFETSFGDLLFMTPQKYLGAVQGINVVMIDSSGEFIWRQYFEDMHLWNNYADIIETNNQNLAFVATTYSESVPACKLKLLDYSSGEEILDKSYDYLQYPKTIIELDEGFTILGDSDYLGELFLLNLDHDGNEIWRKDWISDTAEARKALDIIYTSDDGYLIFCYSDPAPYATLIQTNNLGEERFRMKYNDYIGGGQGWIHQTEDGGYFMGSGYAVTKLDANYNVIWNAAAAVGFDKYFSNGMVSGVNHDMKKIDVGAVFVGYGSADWE